MEPIVYKRKVIWYEVFFGVLVIAGLYIIFNVETDYVLGIILALISAFLSAVFSLINGKLAQKGDASVISFYELLIGVIAITIYLGFDTFIGEASAGFTSEFFQLSIGLYSVCIYSICCCYEVPESIYNYANYKLRACLRYNISIFHLWK